MGIADLSRAAFDARKRYAGVRMQQGRVMLDDDFNESERIDDEDERRALLDVIGPAGSPDDGFLVSNGHIGPTGVTFDVAAGTMYLGGLRVWNPERVDYATQPDWLLQPAAERAAPAAGQRQLAYLEVWRQGATAIEDAELFEAALAGPDTSARVRLMWRVRLAATTATDCKAAWDELVAGWQAAGLGTLQPTGERTVDAALTVGYEADGPAGDLCAPPAAGGYLGAENQAIRVELVSPSTFTWGFDNAAPLYRVKVGADHVTITLDTDPKDQAHWPLGGQIVEILPWSAVLPDGEKLAELSGHLSRVAGSYDPESRTITLASAVPAGFGEEWTSRADAGDLAPTGDDRHYYLRVWNRGDDQASPVAIPFVAGTPVPLGSTGLNVTFAGTQLVPADHWIIAARPETPDQVVPWSLEVGRGPHGVRRFYTPLALIQWQGGANGLVFDLLSDCRRRFLPLTRLRTCCTYTVGDEVHSFGMFKSIQQAIDHLPDAGGKICVLPGEYPEQVVIQGRRDVTIEGCGKRSRILPAAKPAIAGVLVIGSQDIVIRDLFIEAGEQVGVLLFDRVGPTPVGAPASPGFFGGGVLVGAEVARAARTHHVLLEGLVIHAGGRPAVASYGGSFLTLRESEILAGPLPATLGRGDLGRWSAVVMLSDDVLIEENHIAAAPDPVDLENEPTGAPATFARMAMGGIQIGGGSERVEIRRNRITAGNGDGVTLGSWAWVARPADGGPPIDFVDLSESWIWSPGGWHLVINDEGCIEVEWDPDPPDDPDGEPLYPVSMGDLRDIRILDNDIRLMGRCGIGVARYFDLAGVDELIRVDRLTIDDNRIIGCLRLPIPELPESMRGEAALGAIALADGEIVVIRDNVIERNGRSHVDPVCGIFALRAAGLSVERNRIVDNAPRTASIDPARTGYRGGIVVLSALPPAVEIVLGEVDGLRASGVPAARIVHNVVVVPEGRCLVLVGQGTFAVSDNQLTSRGVGTANLAGGQIEPGSFQGLMDLLGGATVLAVNVGRSNELGAQVATWQKLADVEVEAASGLDPVTPILSGGDVALCDNHITLDLLERAQVAVLSSIVLLSLDDVLVDGNQMQVEQNGDLVAAQLLGLGWSFRLTGNRLEETLIVNNGITAGLSAFVLAPLGTMTSNQSSHCLVLTAALRVFADNIQLIQLANQACSGADSAASQLDAKYMRSRS